MLTVTLGGRHGTKKASSFCLLPQASKLQAWATEAFEPANWAAPGIVRNRCGQRQHDDNVLHLAKLYAFKRVKTVPSDGQR
ncbi:hypothetical protein VTN00DRAFT_9001 [Thermoascus crustaceus]|uniref:uncharacterized protein n=1 Tax=Thermoascus crustaceus TaxID=5088 RepID=UPI00374295B2